MDDNNDNDKAKAEKSSPKHDIDSDHDEVNCKEEDPSQRFAFSEEQQFAQPPLPLSMSMLPSFPLTAVRNEESSTGELKICSNRHLGEESAAQTEVNVNSEADRPTSGANSRLIQSSSPRTRTRPRPSSFSIASTGTSSEIEMARPRSGKGSGSAKSSSGGSTSGSGGDDSSDASIGSSDDDDLSLSDLVEGTAVTGSPEQSRPSPAKKQKRGITKKKKKLNHGVVTKKKKKSNRTKPPKSIDSDGVCNAPAVSLPSKFRGDPIIGTAGADDVVFWFNVHDEEGVGTDKQQQHQTELSKQCSDLFQRHSGNQDLELELRALAIKTHQTHRFIETMYQRFLRQKKRRFLHPVFTTRDGDGNGNGDGDEDEPHEPLLVGYIDRTRDSRPVRWEIQKMFDQFFFPPIDDLYVSDPDYPPQAQDTTISCAGSSSSSMAESETESRASSSASSSSESSSEEDDEVDEHVSVLSLTKTTGTSSSQVSVSRSAADDGVESD
jgi:hypothetical protein